MVDNELEAQKLFGKLWSYGEIRGLEIENKFVLHFSF